VDDLQIHREVPSPIPCLEQNVRWATSVSGDIHLPVMWNSGMGKDVAEKGLCAKVPISKSRLLTHHGVVAEDVYQPPTEGARPAHAVCRQQGHPQVPFQQR